MRRKFDAPGERGSGDRDDRYAGAVPDDERLGGDLAIRPGRSTVRTIQELALRSSGQRPWYQPAPARNRRGCRKPGGLYGFYTAVRAVASSQRQRQSKCDKSSRLPFFGFG